MFALQLVLPFWEVGPFRRSSNDEAFGAAPSLTTSCLALYFLAHHSASGLPHMLSPSYQGTLEESRQDRRVEQTVMSWPLGKGKHQHQEWRICLHSFDPPTHHTLLRLMRFAFHHASGSKCLHMEGPECHLLCPLLWGEGLEHVLARGQPQLLSERLYLLPLKQGLSWV